PPEPVADKPPESVAMAPAEAATPAGISPADEVAASSVDASEELAAEPAHADGQSTALPMASDTAPAADEMQSVPEVLAVVATSAAGLKTRAGLAEDDARTAAARAVPAELAEPAEPAAVPPIAAAEPEMIDVWRPGRAEGRPRPPRKHRDRDRHFGRRTGAD